MIQQAPPTSEQEWADWAAAQKIRKRYRKRAVQAALDSLSSGASSEEAALAGRNAAWEAENAEWATGSLVFGALSAVISLLTRGLSIVFSILAVLGGINGLKSRTRRWQAIVGMVLAGLGVVFFAVAHLLR